MNIIWFRKDLRLSDNPALVAACKKQQVLAIYINNLNDKLSQNNKSCSKIWLHHALKSLNKDLGEKLNIYQGSPEKILQDLFNKHKITGCFWNTCFEPNELELSASIHTLCKQFNIQSKEFNGNYLWHPKDILKDDGSYYKVFTPFKKKALSIPTREVILDNIKSVEFVKIESLSIDNLNLLPSHSWGNKISAHWSMTEKEANTKLEYFLKNHIHDYKEKRNYPALNQVSQLSPYLHFGQISPNQILSSVNKFKQNISNNVNTNLSEQLASAEHFISELVWREFSCYLLFYFPNLQTQNFNNKFDSFPWWHPNHDQAQTHTTSSNINALNIKTLETNSAYEHDMITKLKAWQMGKTGYPIIDAGMRQLWQTGYMHNRVRMITASFLVKNLNIHWKLGEQWFWDCLVDADMANNAASWQWVAGSGADAAPYFRIFNPILQAQKFDPDGKYITEFVPELSKLPKQYLFTPWLCPADILIKANVSFEYTSKHESNPQYYPKPIIDFYTSREHTLQQFQAL